MASHPESKVGKRLAVMNAEAIESEEVEPAILTLKQAIASHSTAQVFVLR